MVEHVLQVMENVSTWLAVSKLIEFGIHNIANVYAIWLTSENCGSHIDFKSG